MAQHRDLSGQLWHEFPKTIRKIHASVNHGQRDDRFRCHITHEKMLVHAIKTKLCRQAFQRAQYTGIFSDELQACLNLLEIFGGRSLAPLLDGISLDSEQVGDGSLRKV